MTSGTSVGKSANYINTAFMIGFFTIVGAWGFELIGGYTPCELCYTQRIPYYIGLPVLMLTIGLWQKLPNMARLILTLLAAAIFIWSIYLGAFHAGVEWKFWPGPSSCTGNGSGLSFSDMSALNEVKIIPCDDPSFRFLGISFAGYNALISALMVLFLALSVKGQFKALKS